jgi:hypothetical protein
MRWLPLHHEWPLLIDGDSLQVHWFGRFAGHPERSIERSRLATHMVQTTGPNYADLARCMKQGSNNAVFAARILSKKPNTSWSQH